jgi:DNA invertase Pin-like site-specific DNA recombinase
VDELLKHRKQIIINGKDYEQNPENKLTLTMLGAFAEYERAKIMERMTRGRLHRLRMGEMSSKATAKARKSSVANGSFGIARTG